DVIEHATYADDEAIEMIAAKRDEIIVVPGLGDHWGIPQKSLACANSDAVCESHGGILRKVLACRIAHEMIDASGYEDEWERGCQSMQKMREAGVRIIPGGDYGFIWCPHGENAKDIQIFVTDMGFSPMEAIVAATKHGSQLMRLEDETGTVEAGKFADLPVGGGAPPHHISQLPDRSPL